MIAVRLNFLQFHLHLWRTSPSTSPLGCGLSNIVAGLQLVDSVAVVVQLHGFQGKLRPRSMDLDPGVWCSSTRLHGPIATNHLGCGPSSIRVEAPRGLEKGTGTGCLNWTAPAEWTQASTGGGCPEIGLGGGRKEKKKKSGISTVRLALDTWVSLALDTWVSPCR